MTLRIRHPGACTLVVDEGRPRSRRLGVPVGGAADRAAWQIANALVGNLPTMAALEIALAGPTLECDIPLSLAFFGCDFTIICAGKPVEPGGVFHLLAGQTLKLVSARQGMRGYLAIAGGVYSAKVLDSQSSLEPLAANTELEVQSIAAPRRSLRHVSIRDLFAMPRDLPIRVVPGPQADWFDINEFVSRSFTVSPASNRMGIRLEGKPVSRPEREMVSEAVAPGAIQVTNEGLPIILGVDGQTIGGYPKIAHVIDADLDRLAQLAPRDEVRFQLVTHDEAEWIDRVDHQNLQQWLMRLRVAEGLPTQFASE